MIRKNGIAPEVFEASGARKASSTTSSDSKDTTAKPVFLPDALRTELVSRISPNALAKRRMVSFLAQNPDSKTGDVNRISSVNLGHIKRKVNPLIEDLGYKLDWRSPPNPILNAFGEASGQVLWGIYKLEEIDNDFL